MAKNEEKATLYKPDVEIILTTSDGVILVWREADRKLARCRLTSLMVIWPEAVWRQTPGGFAGREVQRG